MEKGTPMPKFMIKATYTAEGIKGLKKDTASGREKSIAAACEAMGGELDALYSRSATRTFSPSLICFVHAASLASAASASGLVETHTVSLLTIAEMDKAHPEKCGAARRLIGIGSPPERGAAGQSPGKRRKEARRGGVADGHSPSGRRS